MAVQAPSSAPSAQPSGRLPDFIIGGAMKSGTTTLHHLLADHPQVYIPHPEIHFFCLDDAVEMPDLFYRFRRHWSFHDYDAHFEDYLAWYRQFFAPAQANQLAGEDSTVYLASEKAPARIAALLPQVKLIFLIRDPVYRTYSHYWHQVRMGRAFYSFEQMLQHAPSTLLTRSYYFAQLTRYYQLFSPDQIRVLVFEDFIKRQQETLDDLCRWLGLPPTSINVHNAHRNTAQTPRFASLQLLQNRLLSPFAPDTYLLKPPHMPAYTPGRITQSFQFLHRGLRYLNSSSRRYPPMRRDTRAFLERLMAKENAGLSDLLGLDLRAYWPYMQG
jgi:hypothetical protein